METYELENEIYAALIGNAELISILPLGERSIFHHAAPTIDPKRYPIIVYSSISDVPALNGDNREIAHRVTIRIHVIAVKKLFEADERNFITACKLVKEIMTGLNFSRLQTTPFIDDGKIMRIFDFVKGVES